MIKTLHRLFEMNIVFEKVPRGNAYSSSFKVIVLLEKYILFCFHLGTGEIYFRAQKSSEIKSAVAVVGTSRMFQLYHQHFIFRDLVTSSTSSENRFTKRTYIFISFCS